MNNEDFALVADGGPKAPNMEIYSRLGVYDWERYFNAAQKVLAVESHIKGDTTINYKTESSEAMITLSQHVIEQLMELASKHLMTVTKLGDY